MSADAPELDPAADATDPPPTLDLRAQAEKARQLVDGGVLKKLNLSNQGATIELNILDGSVAKEAITILGTSLVVGTHNEITRAHAISPLLAVVLVCFVRSRHGAVAVRPPHDDGRKAGGIAQPPARHSRSYH